MGKYWVQAECVLIDAEDPVLAIRHYRQALTHFNIGCKTGKHCDALRLVALCNPERYHALMDKQKRGKRDEFVNSMER